MRLEELRTTRFHRARPSALGQVPIDRAAPPTLGPELLQPGFTTIAWQHPIKNGDGFGSAISGVFGKATSYKDWREEVAGALVR